MQTELVTRAAEPESGCRAFAWPVLEAGNGSFRLGTYSIVCDDKEPGRSFLLQHSISDAPLIEKWMTQERLLFVCAVAAPRSMYRALHVSEDPKQLIEWNQEDLGEPPMFTPMILTRFNFDYVTTSQADGLDQIWDNRQLRLPKGARVAIGTTFRFMSGIEGILDFNQNPDLEPGRFEVRASAEDGFRFKVHLAHDLFVYLRHHRSKNETTRRNIMVHVVTAALSLLQKDYGEDDGDEGWRSFRNLVGLANLLQENDLAHWSTDEFSPELVSTGLDPHILPTEQAR